MKESAPFVRTSIALSIAVMFCSPVAANQYTASQMVAVDNGHTILKDEIKDISGTVAQDGTGRVFAIHVKDLNGKQVIEGPLNYHLESVATADGKGGTTRAFQNIGSTLEFTDKVTGYLKVDNKRELDTASHSVYDQYDGTQVADTQFKGDVEFTAVGTTSEGNQSFLSAVRLGSGGNITFSGANSVFKATNTNYTAETLNNSSSTGNLIFNGGNVYVEANSDYGVAGAVLNNALIDNTGDFTIVSNLTDGFGCDLQGLDIGGEVKVTDRVQNLAITLKGATEAGDNRDGTNGIVVWDGANLDVQAKNVTINIDSTAEPVPEGVTVTESYGIINHEKLTIGAQSNTSIVVNNAHADTVGILTTGGTNQILGNLVVKATSGKKEGAYSVQATGGETTLGSANHQVFLEGQVSVAQAADSSATLNVNGVSNIEGNVGVGANGIFNVKGQMSITGEVDNKGQITTDGASLTVNGDGSNLGKVDAKNESRIELGQGSYAFTSINSEGNTEIVLNDLSEKATDLGTVTGKLTRTASGAASDKYASAEEASQALVNAFTDSNKNDAYKVEEGTINDAIEFKVDEKGQIVDQKVTKNTTLDAYSSVATLSAFQWRHEINSVNKRMGELRLNPNGVGAWARLYGSEQEYGAQNVTAKNHSVQVGLDTDVGNGWKVGAAFNYTDGQSTYDAGNGDNKAYGLTAYGTWMADNGQYVDLTAKYSRLDNDFTVNSMAGDYSNNAYSVSAEYGWHFKMADIAFVEPQVEVMYGKVMGDNFKANNGVTIEQEDFESLITRAGVRSGFYFPENKGVIYARASVLHDFKGEMESTARFGTGVNTVKDDIGGTWYELGLGANFNMSPTSYIYVDLERTNGGAVVENWRYNLGFRKVF